MHKELLICSEEEGNQCFKEEWAKCVFPAFTIFGPMTSQRIKFSS